MSLALCPQVVYPVLQHLFQEAALYCTNSPEVFTKMWEVWRGHTCRPPQNQMRSRSPLMSAAYTASLPRLKNETGAKFPWNFPQMRFLCGKFRSLYLGKAARAALLVCTSVCSIFLFSNNGVAPVFEIFNVCTDADACSCTWGLYKHCQWVCTESWLGEVSCRTGELNLHQYCTRL